MKFHENISIITIDLLMHIRVSILEISNQPAYVNRRVNLIINIHTKGLESLYEIRSEINTTNPHKSPHQITQINYKKPLVTKGLKEDKETNENKGSNWWRRLVPTSWAWSH